MEQRKSKPESVASSFNRVIDPSVPTQRSTSLAQSSSLRQTQRVKHIALSFPIRLGPWQEIVRGIYRYADSIKSWTISFHTEEDVSVALAGKPDGVIAMIRATEAVCKLQEWGGPVVVTASEVDDLPFIQIGFDLLAAGKIAAEHLMLLKSRSFVYLGNSDRSADQLLRQGFAQRLNRAGFDALDAPSGINHLSSPNAWSDRTITAWLTALPRPIAVFACNDLLAHRLAGACMGAGLRVPHDVAILGCMNDQFLCNASQPPLSSVGVSFSAIGHEAARTLDALTISAPVAQRIDFPPLGVIARQSTDHAAIAEPALAAALGFIRDNASKRIGVADIAAACGLSRSSLERRFRVVLGRSPLAELMRERMDRAQHLLAETNLAIKEIATAAGFHDVRHLTVTFRQKAGVTPGKYRAKFHPV